MDGFIVSAAACLHSFDWSTLVAARQARLPHSSTVVGTVLPWPMVRAECRRHVDAARRHRGLTTTVASLDVVFDNWSEPPVDPTRLTLQLRWLGLSDDVNTVISSGGSANRTGRKQLMLPARRFVGSGVTSIIC